jgi:hypothetical protein
MKRYLALFGAALLAVSSSLGSISAQTGIPVNANGSSAVADDDGMSTASGAGEDIYYGDVSTGGARGETLGDPNAVYSPMVPDNPGPDGGVPVMPGTGDGLMGGVPIMPIPAAPGAATTPAPSPAGTEGATTESVPVEAAAPAETAPVATDTTAATGGFCSQYVTWYDAQIAYENLGATAADPALVQEVDPNYDGIACEEMMA